MSLLEGFQGREIGFIAGSHTVFPTSFSLVQDLCSYLSRNSLLAFNLNAFFFFTIFLVYKSGRYLTQFTAVSCGFTQQASKHQTAACSLPQQWDSGENWKQDNTHGLR